HRGVLQACVQQLVVVDDGSADGTFEVAERFLSDRRVSVHRHAVNRGKGAAIRTAVESVTAPLVIIQDADLEYDPLEYQIMISPLLQGRADVVYGVLGLVRRRGPSHRLGAGHPAPAPRPHRP